MSLKDSLLFLGQPKDGKEKQTVFGKLKGILDAIGNPSDSAGGDTILEQLNIVLKNEKRKYKVTAEQKFNLSTGFKGTKTFTFSLPENANFITFVISANNDPRDILITDVHMNVTYRNNQQISYRDFYWNYNRNTFYLPYGENTPHYMYIGLKLYAGDIYLMALPVLESYDGKAREPELKDTISLYDVKSISITFNLSCRAYAHGFGVSVLYNHI